MNGTSKECRKYYEKTCVVIGKLFIGLRASSPLISPVPPKNQ